MKRFQAFLPLIGGGVLLFISACHPSPPSRSLPESPPAPPTPTPARVESARDEPAPKYPPHSAASPRGVTRAGLPPVTGRIHVDQFGYLPDAVKVAVISDPQTGFNAFHTFVPSDSLEVRRAADGQTVFSGPVTLWNHGETDPISGDRGWWFDFSPVNEPGEYYLFDPVAGLRSPAFEISDTVYHRVLIAAVRTYFYQRLNTNIHPPHAEEPWVLDSALEQDAVARYVNDKDNPATERDLRGGWMDAGDANKYPTFNNEVIHGLLYAYRSRPEIFTDDFGIPESGNGLPDLLDELKFQLDWLVRMQEPDGGVLLKLGFINHDSVHPLSEDDRPRFYVGPCSGAALSFAGYMAHAARVYREFPEWEAFADDLEDRALRAWEWLQRNPMTTDLDTGEVKAGSANLTENTQRRMRAQVSFHLWRLTGEERFHRVFLEHLPLTRQMKNYTWDLYEVEQNEALFEYLKSPGADPDAVAAIRAQLEHSVGHAGWLPPVERDLYRAWVAQSVFHWGSNRVRAGAGHVALSAMLELGDHPARARLHERAAGQLHYLHGKNPLGMTYLTNMGVHGAERSAMYLYHHNFGSRASFSGNVPPGYLVGGPKQNFSGKGPPSSPDLLDWIRQQPPAKSYADFDLGWPMNSWELSENAIYYQAAYIRLLTEFVHTAPRR